MRFGLDVAQHRMPWDELVRRVQLAEELGFDGAWGFDHFQPMYGEGPGETLDLDAARRDAARWRDAGYGYLVCGWPDAGRAQVERFAREVLTDFG
jgi:hypothetical protein